MILGIGTDMVDIRRIENLTRKFGDRFLARVFTDTERRRAAASPLPSASFAKRFAAKEACAKALGTGFRVWCFHVPCSDRAGGPSARHHAAA